MTFEDYVTSHTAIVDAIFRSDGGAAAALALVRNTADGQAAVHKLRRLEMSRSADQLQIVAGRGRGDLA